MSGQDLWTLKLKAFLRCPPYRAFIRHNQEKGEAKELIKLVLNDDNIPNEVDEAHENAYALDSPPFVRSCDIDFFREPILTHPLSGDKWKLKESPLTEGWNGDKDAFLAQVKKAVEDALNCFKAKYNDPKKLFLALWRLLPEKETGIGPIWDVVPADPCVPDRSIWDHASVASALAPAFSEGKPAFLIFTIASVHGFLAEARRTQDLWMGSFLLSFLMWEAMKVVADKYGPDCLIYPELRGQPLVDLWLSKEMDIAEVKVPSIDVVGIANLPNMFTAVLPEGCAEGIAEEAEKAMRKAWKEVAYKVKTAMEGAIRCSSMDDIWNEVWKRQVEDFPDGLGVFWVVYPWEDDPKKALDNFKKVRLLEKPPPLEELLNVVKKMGGQLKPGMAYQALSSLASFALTSRKNLRDFPQKEEPGHRCSLCGIRDALHLKDKDVSKFWPELMKIDKPKLRGRIRRGDRLCAVCLTKRLAWEHYFIPYFQVGNKRRVSGIDSMAHVLFPSTASIATAKFKEKAIERFREGELPELRNYVEEVKEFLKGHDIFFPSAPIPKLEKLKEGLPDDKKKTVEDFLMLDGEWLFVESFDREAIEREYGLERDTINKEALQSARKALEGLLGKAEELGIRRPRKYYALISMDGDKMGDWLAGKNGPNLGDLIHPSATRDIIMRNVNSAKVLGLDRPLGPSLHKGLSGALRNFSLYAVKCAVEEEHCGKLIYSGGDDVLAFVPLDELFAVMRELRLLFAGEGSLGRIKEVGPGFLEVEDGKGRICTMGGKEGLKISAGAVIAHYTHPFSHAVEEAYEEALEKDAKETQGRDAFAIHLLKRSGEPVKVGAKWRYKDVDVLEVLDYIACMIKKQKLSSRLVYRMKEEASGLSVELGVWNLDQLNNARVSELKRLISRHVKAEDEGKEIEKKLEKLLMAMDNFWNQGSSQAQERRRKLWDEVVGLLSVARFVAEET